MIHKLKNITYDLVKMKNGLVFKILKQSKKWRCKKVGWENILKYKCKNGLIILSNMEVNLRYLTLKINPSIRLLGWMKYTKPKICELEFKTNTQRDKYYNKINQAMDEWDLHVEKLKQEKK